MLVNLILWMYIKIKGEMIMIKLILAMIITLVFYIRNKIVFKLRVLLHPILLTPLLGLFFGEGGFITGITIGVIVELIWGSNLIDYEFGLKYSCLVSLLTVSLVLLTGNISLFFNLALVVILVFSLQESCSFLEEKNYFILIIFAFNLVMLFSAPLIKELLGLIPAQFLNDLAISGGALLPIVGLSLFLIQAIRPILRYDNLWYYSYAISTIITSVLLLNYIHWLLIIIFPIIWYLLYYFAQSQKVSRIHLRVLLFLLVIINTPLIVEWSNPNLSNSMQYFLWVQAVVALFSILRIFKLTAIEGYFIMSLLGIVGAKLGLLM